MNGVSSFRCQVYLECGTNMTVRMAKTQLLSTIFVICILCCYHVVLKSVEVVEAEVVKEKELQKSQVLELAIGQCIVQMSRVQSF